MEKSGHNFCFTLNFFSYKSKRHFMLDIQCLTSRVWLLHKPPLNWWKSSLSLQELGSKQQRRLRTQVDYLDTLAERSCKHDATEKNHLDFWICEWVLLMGPVGCLLLQNKWLLAAFDFLFFWSWLKRKQNHNTILKQILNDIVIVHAFFNNSVHHRRQISFSLVNTLIVKTMYMIIYHNVIYLGKQS